MLAAIEADRQADTQERKVKNYLDSRCTCHHWRCLHTDGPCERQGCDCQGFVHKSSLDSLPADYGEQQIAILDAIGVEPGTPWEPPTENVVA